MSKSVRIILLGIICTILLAARASPQEDHGVEDDKPATAELGERYCEKLLGDVLAYNRWLRQTRTEQDRAALDARVRDYLKGLRYLVALARPAYPDSPALDSKGQPIPDAVVAHAYAPAGTKVLSVNLDTGESRTGTFEQPRTHVNDMVSGWFVAGVIHGVSPAANTELALVGVENAAVSLVGGADISRNPESASIDARLREEFSIPDVANEGTPEEHKTIILGMRRYENASGTWELVLYGVPAMPLESGYMEQEYITHAIALREGRAWRLNPGTTVFGEQVMLVIDGTLHLAYSIGTRNTGHWEFAVAAFLDDGPMVVCSNDDLQN